MEEPNRCEIWEGSKSRLGPSFEGGGESDRERERENLVEDKNMGSDTNKLGLKEKKRVELEMTRRDETRREEKRSRLRH